MIMVCDSSGEGRELGCGSMVECLPSSKEVLSSSPSNKGEDVKPLWGKPHPGKKNQQVDWVPLQPAA